MKHPKKVSLTRIAVLSMMGLSCVSSGRAQVTEQVIASALGDPYDTLIADAAGNLYGTSSLGGTDGAGDVFELSPPMTAGGEWTQTVLYSFPFSDTSDSAYFPYGGLVFDKQGNLYGTNQGGGPAGVGSVFELSPPATLGGTWTETTLLNFDGKNGGLPFDTMSIDEAGNLYGTALGGGKNDLGVVFEMVKPKIAGEDWKERVIYNFGASATDGIFPEGSLLLRGGVLYGTTFEGGAHKNRGTIFQLTRQPGLWVETVLYNFRQENDGQFPKAGLVADDAGNLYGTTSAGGNSKCPGGCGTVFELSPPAIAGGSWQEKILFEFTREGTGAAPVGSLWRNKLGKLYGTTSKGGSGDGTVFQLDPPVESDGTWTYVFLHNFKNDPDGANPNGGLVLVNGAFYGTTLNGGMNVGTVFKLVP